MLNGDIDYSAGNQFGDKATISCNRGLVVNSLLQDLFKYLCLARSISIKRTGLLVTFQRFHVSVSVDVSLVSH